jgi:ABC-2 type transport system ATP-binding protein
MKYAIETFDLTKKYGDFLAVDELNLKVDNKSIFGFLGPNGAGKTTTIKMLTCLIPSTSGTANVSGYDIVKSPNEVRQKIGMVPQLVSLYGDLTARENAELCADYYGLPKDLKEERINDLMELVDIKYAQNKMVKQLSGGQKQKVSVVASLVHQPDILFLDEPTIGLDPTTKSVLWELIQELNDDGHTIILCSHDMYEVDMLCDHVGIIDKGLLEAYDTPQGLKDDILEDQDPKSRMNISQIMTELEENSNVSEVSSYHKLKGSMMESEIANAREISIKIDNMCDSMMQELQKLPFIFEITPHQSGRVSMKISNSTDSVTAVISTIIKNEGNISSISTQDPSLEDVFMKVTTKHDVEGE